ATPFLQDLLLSLLLLYGHCPPHPSNALYSFLFYSYADHPFLPSFPTRRSSDLRSGCPPRGCSSASTTSPTRPARSSPLPTPKRRSEEHTSELQSRRDLVCRLLLEKKKIRHNQAHPVTH